MKFTRTKPCAKCPFRVDVPGYLRRARAIDIQRVLLEGGTFICHETVTYDDEDRDVHTGREVHCAGALIAQIHATGPGQMARIAERMGEADLTAFEVDPDEVGVLRLYDLADHHESRPETDLEFCNIVDVGCDNPVGFAAGGGAIENADGPQVSTYCVECGEPACDSCMDGDRCIYCAQWREEVEV